MSNYFFETLNSIKFNYNFSIRHFIVHTIILVSILVTILIVRDGPQNLLKFLKNLDEGYRTTAV